MDKGQLRYDLKVIRKAYREVGRDPIFCLTIFVLVIIFAASIFLMIAYEPVENWHETSFALHRMEIRSTGRTGHVLDVYTADGRSFVINRNEEEIREQLQIGNTYSAVYSADCFHNIIQGLQDKHTLYLDLRSSQREAKIAFRAIYCAFFATGILLLVLNWVYASSCVKRERKRMQKFQNSKRKHK